MGCLRVEVTDSGVGLTAEEQSNLFGEFTQFNKNELQAGGMYLVYKRMYVCMYVHVCMYVELPAVNE